MMTNLFNEIEHWRMYPDDSSQFLNCYIGVTGKRLKERWTDHACNRTCRKPTPVKTYIKEHELTFDDNMIVIFRGTRKQCLELEYKLRPFPNMSLNRHIGGQELKFRVAA